MFHKFSGFLFLEVGEAPQHTRSLPLDLQTDKKKSEINNKQIKMTTSHHQITKVSKLFSSLSVLGGGRHQLEGKAFLGV